jgi:hypothetical protein
VATLLFDDVDDDLGVPRGPDDHDLIVMAQVPLRVVSAAVGA